MTLYSSVAIGPSRRGETVAAMLRQIVISTGDQRAVLSAVGLTELAHGIYRAQPVEARKRRGAATALEVGYAVLTTNVRHFQLIPGLAVARLQV